MLDIQAGSCRFRRNKKPRGDFTEAFRDSNLDHWRTFVRIFFQFALSIRFHPQRPDVILRTKKNPAKNRFIHPKPLEGPIADPSGLRIFPRISESILCRIESLKKLRSTCLCEDFFEPSRIGNYWYPPKSIPVSPRN